MVKKCLGASGTQRVLISLPPEILAEMDSVASEENRSRSELIRESFRMYVSKKKIRENTQAAKNVFILESMLG